MVRKKYIFILGYMKIKLKKVFRLQSPRYIAMSVNVMCTFENFNFKT